MRWTWLLGGLLACAAWLPGPGQARSAGADAAPRIAGPAAFRERTRVVAMLRLPAQASDRSLRPALVRDAVRRTLAALPVGGWRLQRRFELVPALVLEVDATALRALSRAPLVARVDADVGGAATGVPADEASVLNHVSGMGALGFDGAGLKVAVIDSGVDRFHPDLANRLLDEACFCSSTSGTAGCCPNGAATQSGAGAAQDGNGHGTNVAGIVVGEGAVAPRGAVPGARLIAVRVLDAGNRFCCTSDVVAAMDWLAAHHPDVAAVNLSLGTDTLFDGDCDAATAWTQALASAVDALVSGGAVVSVSSGNDRDAQRMEAPACIAKALSLAATWDGNVGAPTVLGCTETATAARQPTCFANRSPTTDLFAAGAFVTSTGLGGGTSTYAGTSQAAPMATGCAVALRDAAPAATPAQRIDAMKLSATRIADAKSGRGYPFLDCIDALRILNPAAVRPIPVNDSPPLIPRRATPVTLRAAAATRTAAANGPSTVAASRDR